MKFETLGIHQAFMVRIERRADSRGFFARTYCAREFAEAGLPDRMVQVSTSFNARRGTVRGLHFQWPPSQEGKLVRCVKGSMFDVLLDLRPGSPTFHRHLAILLDDESRDAVFIPHGVAHGFQTLIDGTEVLYQMTDVHAPELASGVRWNDPAFGIEWPVRDNLEISARDADYPDFDCQAHAAQFERRSRSSA